MKREAQVQQKSKLIHCLTLLGACFAFVLSKPVLAGFDVVDGSDGKFYGNAQNSTFKNAVEGFDSLDEKDKAFLANVEDSRSDHRWYVRLFLGQPRTTLKNIKNTSSGGAFINPVTGLPIVYASGVPIAEVQTKDDSFTGLVTWGYRWRKWAIEWEWLFSETLKYNASPIAPTVPMNVQSDITRVAAFWNLEYTFDKWFDFYPNNLGIYVLAGIGGTYYSADTTTLYLNGQPRLSDSTTKTNAIWQIGIGTRYQISSHFLIEATYRYIDLGKVKFGPLDAGLAFEADKIRSTGAFLGITYQL